MTTARDVMNRGAQTLTEDRTVLDAARLMKDLGIGSLPIVSTDGELIGMLTDRDIVVQCLADGRDPATTTGASLARGNVRTCDADADIDAVLTAMREHQVKRMPVLSDGAIIGMISESDLVAELSATRVAHYAQGVYAKS